MNKGVLYLLKNEFATRVTMVHVHSSDTAAADLELFESTTALLNMEYPRLIINALAVRDSATSSIFRLLSRTSRIQLDLDLYFSAHAPCVTLLPWAAGRRLKVSSTPRLSIGCQRFWTFRRTW
jgi:hypothetical protein